MNTRYLTMLFCCVVVAFSLTKETVGDEPFIGINPNQFISGTRAARFLPGDKQVLTLSVDKTVRLVEVGSGEIANSFRFQAGAGRRGELTSFDLSDDGKMFAVGTFGEPGVWEPTIYVVSIADRKILHVLKGHRRSVASVRFSPNGSQLASSGEDSQIAFWDLKNGTREKSLFLSHPDKPKEERKIGRLIRYADDGSQLACTTESGNIYSFNPVTYKKIWSTSPHRKLITGLAWVDRFVITASLDGQLVVSDSNDEGRKTETSRNFGEDNNFLSLARQPGTQRVFWSNGASDTIEEWLNNNGIFKRDGSTHELGVYDIETGSTQILKRDQRYGAISFSKDGSQFTSCNLTRGLLNVVDTKNLTVSKSIQCRVKPKFQPRLLGPDKSKIAWGEQFHHKSGQVRQPETFDTINLQRSRRSDDVLPKQMYDRLDGKLFGLQQNSNYKWGVWDLGGNKSLLQQGQLDRGRMGNRIIQYAMLAPNKVFISTDTRQLILNPFSKGNAIELTGQIGTTKDVQRNLKKGIFLTTDSTTCFSIWDVNTTGNPLVNYLVSDHDYVAWTPDGHYACSAGGERLVGWHVNNGEKEFASFLPLEKFSEKYFNEPLIRSIGQNKLAKQTAKPAEPIVKNIPAAVEIVEPRKHEIETDSNQITFKVRASSKQGRGKVSEVSLLINNHVRTEYFLTPEDGKEEFEFNVRLEPGQQAIRARVYSNDTGNTSESSQTVYVTYTPPNAQRKPIRKLYFLGIGIDKYEHFDDLNYCVSDVESVASILGTGSEQLFMEKPEIKVLTDIKTKDQFFEAIDEIKETFGATDLLVVYWSGHGANDNNKDFHFVLPSCKDPEIAGSDATLRRAGISADDLAKELASENMHGHIVVLLGTCFSGRAVNRIEQSIERMGRESSRTGKGLMMISSAGASQEAFEDSELKSSKFAHQLKKALQGIPTQGVAQMPYYCEAVGSDCVVYTDSMKDYLIESMKFLTNGLQKPVPSGFDYRSFKLTRVKNESNSEPGSSK